MEEDKGAAVASNDEAIVTASSTLASDSSAGSELQQQNYQESQDDPSKQNGVNNEEVPVTSAASSMDQERTVSPHIPQEEGDLLNGTVTESSIKRDCAEDGEGDGVDPENSNHQNEILEMNSADKKKEDLSFTDPVAALAPVPAQMPLLDGFDPFPSTTTPDKHPVAVIPSEAGDGENPSKTVNENHVDFFQENNTHDRKEDMPVNTTVASLQDGIDLNTPPSPVKDSSGKKQDVSKDDKNSGLFSDATTPTNLLDDTGIEAFDDNTNQQSIATESSLSIMDGSNPSASAPTSMPANISKKRDSGVAAPATANDGNTDKHNTENGNKNSEVDLFQSQSEKVESRSPISESVGLATPPEIFENVTISMATATEQQTNTTEHMIGKKEVEKSRESIDLQEEALPAIPSLPAQNVTESQEKEETFENKLGKTEEIDTNNIVHVSNSPKTNKAQEISDVGTGQEVTNGEKDHTSNGKSPGNEQNISSTSDNGGDSKASEREAEEKVGMHISKDTEATEEAAAPILSPTRINKQSAVPTNTIIDEVPLSPTLVALPPLAKPPSGTSKAVKGHPENPPSSGVEQHTKEGSSSSPLSQTEQDSAKSSDTSIIASVGQVSERLEKDSPTRKDNEALRRNNKFLLERIQRLEKELGQSQGLVADLEAQHKRHEDASASQQILVVDIQTNLEKQMSQRAEAEDKARRAITAAKALKEKFEKLGTESKEQVKRLESKLSKMSSHQTDIEEQLKQSQIDKNRAVEKEAAMAMRLNEMLKSKGDVENSVKYYEDQSYYLKQDLEKTKILLETTTKNHDQLKSEVAQWKEYAQSRSKQLKTALNREKQLNSDRRRKMKEFIEIKTEEVRAAKSETLSLQTEMDQNNMTVKDLNQRYKQLHTQWVESQTQNRELKRDMTKMKKDSEKMSKVGGSLEAKLSRSAQQSEDHKNKRLAAKNELMSVLRQLENEKSQNIKIREKLKENFTPKALSQQQSIQDLMDTLESIIQKTAVKLGRPVPPLTRNEAALDTMANENADSTSSTTIDAATQRALNKLENEMKRVSQYIQGAVVTSGRLQSLVEAPSTRGCVDVFSSFLMASGDNQAYNGPGTNTSR